METNKESIAYKATRKMMQDFYFCKCRIPKPISNKVFTNTLGPGTEIVFCTDCKLVIKEAE